MERFIKFDEMLTELQAAGAQVNEMNKVAQLLLTLPTSYYGIVTAIQTLAEKDLTLTFVKTKLLDYGTKIKQENPDTSSKVLQIEQLANNRPSNKLNYDRKVFKNYKRNKFNNKTNRMKCADVQITLKLIATFIKSLLALIIKTHSTIKDIKMVWFKL